MICTSRFSFIHLHKAAGQSINDALLKCIPDAREIGYHYPISMLPASAASLPIIGVVRNPGIGMSLGTRLITCEG
ncbi:MAG: hypothetical protein CM15mP84_03130 [Cellvibrionales bacterium]|nr:MAG: hypothetical protein CM15mP84_03130 [Cellvibrionales bacterium]